MKLKELLSVLDSEQQVKIISEDGEETFAYSTLYRSVKDLLDAKVENILVAEEQTVYIAIDFTKDEVEHDD